MYFELCMRPIDLRAMELAYCGLLLVLVGKEGGFDAVLLYSIAMLVCCLYTFGHIKSQSVLLTIPPLCISYISKDCIETCQYGVDGYPSDGAMRLA